MTAATDNLKAIASQLNALGDQLHGIVERLHKNVPQMSGEVCQTSSPEIEDAEARLRRLREDWTLASKEYENVIDETSAAEAKLESVRSEHTDLESQVKAQRQELDELRAEKERLGETADEARKLVAQLPSIHARQAEAESKLARLSAQEAELAESARQGERSQQLLAKLWPTWLLGSDLAIWKDEIEQGAFDTNASPSFGLLFAALHGYNAALRDADPKALYDSIRDVGRRLYQWLEDRGLDPTAASDITEVWAEAINNEIAGRCSVQVAVPGNPATNQWMTFPPRGSSSEVATVRSWCVFDAQRRPIHRAEVTV